MTFLAARPMEDFFIHPTLDMDSRPSATISTVDDFDLYDAFPQHKQAASNYHLAKKTPMASLHQSSLSMSYVPQQPDYFHGYASEEEVASPVEFDEDLSLPSEHGYCDDITPGAYIAEAVQQCSRARAVTIHSAGKPRVIDLPKLDLSYRRTSRPSTSFNDGRRGSRLGSIDESRSNRSSQESHSRHDSMGSSTANSPASTAPSSVDEEELAERYTKKSPQRLRHKPLMEAAMEGYAVSRASTLPYGPDLNNSYRHSTDLSDLPSSPTGSYRPSIKKMGKFSSIINLNILGKDSKDSYDIQGHSEALGVSHKVSQGNAPTRKSSAPQRKMVARGARERVPTLRLPSFPGE